jgi:hypothetical protein
MIRVDLRSSRGDILESVSANPNFDPVLAGVDRAAFPILGHLDPYGDTVLNRMQVETLLKEISQIRLDHSIIPVQFVEPLVGLCERCLSRPHRFLWFVGE